GTRLNSLHRSTDIKIVQLSAGQGFTVLGVHRSLSVKPGPGHCPYQYSISYSTNPAVTADWVTGAGNQPRLKQARLHLLATRFNRGYFPWPFANVFRTWTNNPVVRTLLHHMSCPTGQTAANKNRRKQLGRNIHVVGGRGMEEVGITEQLLLPPHDFFTAHGNIVQLGIALGLRQLLRPLLDDCVAWVGFRIDGMTKAHDLFLAGQRPHQDLFSVIRVLH